MLHGDKIAETRLTDLLIKEGTPILFDRVDPAPCCLAVVILLRAASLVSAVQHQGGGAPDVDLGYHAAKSVRSRSIKV